MKFIGITQASNIIGVTPKTLRLWEKEGKRNLIKHLVIIENI